MRRRNFLKLLGVSVAAPVVVGKVLAEPELIFTSSHHFEVWPDDYPAMLSEAAEMRWQRLESEDHTYDAMRYAMQERDLDSRLFAAASRTGKTDAVLREHLLSFGRSV